MPDRTQEILNLEAALNAGVLTVSTGSTSTTFASPADLRKRLCELKAEHTGSDPRPVAASIFLGGR